MAKEKSTSIASMELAGLPAIFQDAGPVADVVSTMFNSTPYAMFASSKGQAFAKLARSLPDLQDNEPVLVFPEPRSPMKLSPFRCYLISAWQHWSVVDSTGQILQSTVDVERAKTAPAGGGKWNEHVEAVLLVCVPNQHELVPCRCTFKTTKTNAAHRMIEARSEAASPEWGNKSPAHKATLAVPQPWGRYTGTISLKSGTSKSTGFKYAAASAEIIPTAVADWQLLANYFKTPACIEQCNAVVEAHNRRIEDVKSLITPEKASA